MKIDPFISELLFDHDCVIVADFGGFIASRKRASINPALHVLSPPSKVLAFNAFLKQNDGVLAQYIARKNGITYREACDLIGIEVSEAFRILETGKRLKLDHIGIIYRDNGGNLQFLPDQNANYLTSSFGLTPVHTPFIRNSESNEVENAVPVTGKVISLPKRRWKILEVVPAAAVLALLFMVPPALDQFNSNLSSMLPFSRINEYMERIKGEPSSPSQITIEYPSPFEIPPASAMVPVTPEQEEQPTPNIEVAVPLTDLTTSETSEPIASASRPVVTPAADTMSTGVIKKYHIIGGCFRLEENADRLISEIETTGGGAFRIGTNASGLHMVSLYQSDDLAEVQAALPRMKQEKNPSVWIYTRK